MLMITNDVDEAILLADRIIPMSAGPGATLGEPVTVRLRRPCDRRALNFDPDYQQTRKAIITFLLNNGPGRSSHGSRGPSPSRKIPQYAGLELSRAEEVA